MKNLSPTQKQNLKRLGRSDEGQALVLTALALVVLMLMAGLGVDVGYLRYQKQQMQKAADAGALAGASALAYNGNWYAAAQNDTAANGFTNGNNGIVVQVGEAAGNPNPWEGPFANQPGYVEVSVSQPQPTFFMRVGGFNNMPVRSWAVANAFGPGAGCIYALDPNDDSKTFLVDGNVSIQSSCGIFVNSSSSDALHKNGASGSVDASTIGVVGGYSGSGFSPTPITGMAPITDPLAYVPAPTPQTTCITGQPVGGVFSPGRYCAGITIHGNSTYTFLPGLYTLIGGMTVDGGSTLNGNGVTFYNTGTAPKYNDYGGIDIGGGVTTNFSAPTDSSLGGVPGVLFFQDRSVPVGSSGSDFGGNSAQVYTGALYFPTTGIEYHGTPSLNAIAMIIVGYTLDFRGNSDIENYTLLPGGIGPITGAILAE